MLVFTNKSQQPTQGELEQALGEKVHMFKAILFGGKIDETTWKYYSKSSGWTLQCKHEGRNLFYIQVTDTGFFVWFTLGQQAKRKAIEQVLSEQLQKEIATAREYKEGTSFKVDPVTPKDLTDIMVLIKLKNEAVMQ